MHDASRNKEADMQLSKKFVDALKLSSIPAYRLAWKAKIHPNTLSKLTIGYLRPKKTDQRLIRIGELLGLKESEIFEENTNE